MCSTPAACSGTCRQSTHARGGSKGERPYPLLPPRACETRDTNHIPDMAATTPPLSDSEAQRKSLPILSANVDAATATGGPLPAPPHSHGTGSHGPNIDYELVLDCVHCGLCTASCPTYVETG